jgi:hypothetical protein
MNSCANFTPHRPHNTHHNHWYFLRRICTFHSRYNFSLWSIPFDFIAQTDELMNVMFVLMIHEHANTRMQLFMVLSLKSQKLREPRVPLTGLSISAASRSMCSTSWTRSFSFPWYFFCYFSSFQYTDVLYNFSSSSTNYHLPTTLFFVCTLTFLSWERSHSSERLLKELLLSVCTHVKTQEWLKRFSQNLKPRSFTKFVDTFKFIQNRIRITGALYEYLYAFLNSTMSRWEFLRGESRAWDSPAIHKDQRSNSDEGYKIFTLCVHLLIYVLFAQSK